jgi:hypothetical protein
VHDRVLVFEHLHLFFVERHGLTVILPELKGQAPAFVAIEMQLVEVAIENPEVAARASCGIVGLPNVGKSTLFNALTETQAAQAANYPFCTIEPNVGNVAVPDARLDKLAQIAGSQKIIPPSSLRRYRRAGARREQGRRAGQPVPRQHPRGRRGRPCLRCFENDDIQHIDNKIDPIADAETVETELMLSDLESLEKRVPAAQKKAAQGDKEAKLAASVLGQALELLREGKPARLVVAQ